MPRRPPLALTAALLVGCTTSGSPGDVSLPAVPGVSGAALAACTALQDRLPEKLAQGQQRRATSPESTTTGAWGDPAVLMRCGGPKGSVRDEPYEFNGVRWRMHDTGASRTWTSEGLKVPVSFEIPDRYSGQAELLAALAPQLLPLRP